MRRRFGRAFHPKQRIGDAVSLVSNRIPAGVWLAGINVQAGKKWTIRGTAKNADLVTAYLTALGKEPRLRNVHLVVSDNALVDQVPVQQFQPFRFSRGQPSPGQPRSKKETRWRGA